MANEATPIPAGVTVEQLTTAGVFGADCDWSEPGESLGKPDRYQRRVYRGLCLHAGSNARRSDGSHVRTDAPWSVAAALPWGAFDHTMPGGDRPTVASGSCATQAEARAAAVAAADALLAAVAARADGHVQVECDAGGCGSCNACNLDWCSVCNGGEAELPTQCPGRAMTSAEFEAVGAGRLDFTRERGWFERSGSEGVSS